MANSDPKTTAPLAPPADRPVCDEWGLYDPEQAGFDAVLRRLFPDKQRETPGIPVAPSTDAARS